MIPSRSLSISSPMLVMFGPTLLELGQYLTLYHDEHGICPMDQPSLARLLADRTPEDAAEAIWNAGARACYGVWTSWLSLPASGEANEPLDLLPAGKLLQRLRSAEQLVSLDGGEAADLRVPRQLLPPNDVSRHVFECKQRIFGRGLSRDFTIMLAVHRLDDVWGARGRVIAGPTAGEPSSPDEWFKLVRGQVRSLSTDEGLRRTIRVGGLATACAISLAFDSVEIYARKQPKSVELSQKALDYAKLGAERICRSFTWSTLIALADDRLASD